jgi:hypothetical protein
MRTRKYYKIVMVHQNPYIASRRGERRVTTLFNMLTKEAAYKTMLDIYNDKFSDERPAADSWYQAVCQSRHFIDGANKTYSDGTRSIYYDSRVYIMEAMTK